MPIIVDNKALRAATDKQGGSFKDKAQRFGTSELTLTKIYEGRTDLQLNKVEHIADKLGLDIHVTFRKRRPAKAEAVA